MNESALLDWDALLPPPGMVGGGGGGEKISPTLVCEKPDDNGEHDESILQLINPVSPDYFYGENA